MTETKQGSTQRLSVELRPRKVRHEQGHCFVYRIPNGVIAAETLPPGDVAFDLYENGKRLGPSAARHRLIRDRGRGRFSVWRDPDKPQLMLFFSASDNSVPRKNGRTYTLVEKPEGFSDCERWLQHPRGESFLSRGGKHMPPPLCANFGITDLCNLKCSICGSQNMLQPVNRRFMDFQLYSMVAETLFPLLEVVEFNSRGEPLLHPRFADMLKIVNDHDLLLSLQTNGTKFTDRNLEVLRDMRGEISISIDATGKLFEYARKGAKWPEVEEGVRRFMAIRRCDRVSTSLYPTLTAKTIQGSRELIDWAIDVGIDRIDFHSYDPIECGTEEVPSPQDLEQLRAYAAAVDAGTPIEIRVDFQQIRTGEMPRANELYAFPNIPRHSDHPDANPVYTCMAPVQSVDIDLDGGVYVCCMLQTRKLGNALTPEAFADCWFGAEYHAARDSLKRTSAEPLYEDCRSCIKRHAGDPTATPR